MTLLSNEQKQLLFDYCIGLTSEKQAAEAELLISSNEEAAEIHSRLTTALSPLESVESDLCPDELAERTIWRLNNVARSSQLRLLQLLADEQSRQVSVKSRFWRNFGEIAAAAAVILLVAGVSIAPLRFLRHKYRCQAQLGRIWKGMNQYSNDHDGRFPAVATTAGSPWWKVGYQGKENYSNTRHIWLLVKGDYVDPADFVCPGSKKARVVRLEPSEMKNYNDFPDRRYVNYSFRIMCPKREKGQAANRKVLMSDVNPLFERLPQNYSKPFKLQLNKALLTLNSINHNRRGQNVLLGDGSVNFVKMRRIGIAADDIFTLQDTQIYQGCEVPSCETDSFLAP